MKKIIKDVKINNLSHSDFDGLNLEEAIVELENAFAFAEQNAKHMQLFDVHLQWDIDQTTNFSGLYFYGKRLETDDEFLRRTDAFKWQEESRRKQQYDEYIRLKKIFEPVDSK